MRKLATIQHIKKIEEIPGADKIELVHILGWKCVAMKGEFKQGDLCVYYEVDSFLPINPLYEFLRSSSYKKNDFMGEGFRVKTQKFRGIISQGLALPLMKVLNGYDTEQVREFKEHISKVIGTSYAKDIVGLDLTEMLGVKLFQVPEEATTGGTIVGIISSINVPHTNENRVQSNPELFDMFKGVPYYITTKMDGSSHSVAVTPDGTFHVTGHNYIYKDDGKSSMYELAKKLHLNVNMLVHMQRRNINSLSIQGELCAPGIQRNKLKLPEPHWYVFTVNVNGKRVGLKETMQWCKDLGLDMVPVEEKGEDLTAVYSDVDALIERAGLNPIQTYPGEPEGIVIRPIEPITYGMNREYLSMKVINNKYLLKQK